ncbi:MAG: LamG-like jellyroll fold domain-containing protein, partial [Planctomycetota bacterium]
EIDPGVIVEPGYTIPGYTIPAVAPDAGCLVAHYEFEGNANDSTANANHGTVHGNPAYAAGMVGDAIVCDATDDQNDYAIVPDSASLSFGTGPFSIGFWVNSSWSGGAKEFIVKNGSAGSEFGGKPPDGPNSGKRYVLKFDGEFRFAIDDDTDKTVCAVDESVIAIGDWLHVTAIRNRTDDKMYIYANGELVAEQSDATELSIDSPGELMSIAAAQKEGGSYVEEIGHWFNGQLDDMRFYNCALTEGNARFLAGVGDKEVPPVEVPPVIEGAVYEPLLLHYEFEGNAEDSSGNAHHGTVVTKGSWPKYGSSQSAGLGQAMEFNDDGDHVVDDDSADYMDGLDALTISCWIKSEKTDRDEGWVHFGTEWSDKRSFRYDKDGNSGRTLQHIIKYGVATTTGNEEEESSDWVQTKEWQHVAMTWQSGAGIKLYIDGILNQASWYQNDQGGVLQGYSQLLVGKGSKDDEGDMSWNGFVDDLRIYNTVLSYGQVRYLAGKMDDLDVPPVYGPMLAGYDFELGDATDSSGNNFHGTLLGGASVVDGELILSSGDKCVDLGSDNRFNLGPIGSNGKAQGPFSVSAWFKMNSWGQSWGNVIVGKRGENGRGWQLRRRGGSQHLCFTTRGPGDDDSEGSISPTLGEWHHVAAMYDGTQKWVYLDNQLDRHQGGINNLTMAGHNVYIGARAVRNDDNPERFFDGDIDDVKFYNLVFTAEELRYLAGLEDLKTPDAYVPLRAHYEFEGDATDSTANNNHGTEQGDPVYVGGMLGQAIDLDGDGDYVSTGRSASYLGIGGNSPRTLSAWVLTRGFCNGGIYDVGNRANDQDFSLRTLDCTDNRWRVQYWAGDYDFTYDSKDKWVHFAHLHDGAYTQIYADGDLIVNWARTINTTDNNPFQVGMYGWTGDAFDGLIDDMRVYDTALTKGQIRTLAGYVSPDFISNTWSGRAAAAPVLEYLGDAHEGAQCMRVEYTGSGAVTRLEPFGDGKHPHGWNGDFSLGQGQALALWFKGDPGNAPGAMFAQLTTVVPSGHTQRVMYDGDPEDLQKPYWQEWTMSLKALSTGKPADPIEEMGLPITKIKDVGVGIIGAGSGALYFDDLRLYPTRCVPKYGPAYDLTDDCVVDREDMGVIANAWLAEEGANGLWYEYYEEYYEYGLPYFPSKPLITQGTADNFDIGVRLRDEGFGFRFTGIVAAPVGGDYTFYTRSDDGSKLYIDGVEVVDNDGYHGMDERQGTINLTVGEHLIEVIMFEYGGGEGLEVNVEGPGIPKMPIPNDVLFLAPGIPADLNGDGIVNFLDYADVLNHFGEELLFPPPGEEL